MTARHSSRTLTVVIAAPIGRELVAPIRVAAAGTGVLYQPDLLAAPLSRCVRNERVLFTEGLRRYRGRAAAQSRRPQALLLTCRIV